MCKDVLLLRIHRLEEASPDVAPILWRDGALARLKDGESIKSMTTNGYCTLSLGFVGVCEAVYALIGESNITEKGKKLALKIVSFLRNLCDEWKKETGYGFSLYSTPAERLCYTFATATKNRFGVIPHVTDKLYFTNSYHIHVTEPIDAFSKLSYEAEFQKISSGGCFNIL